jgi:type I restriction enzyme S subunit
MSEWGKRERLGDLIPEDRPICYGVLKPGDFDPNGVPLVRIVDLEGDVLRREELFHVSPQLDREFSRSRLEGGELLLSIQGTIGRVALVPQDLAGANISRTIARVAVRPEFSEEYVRFVLASENGQKLLSDAVVGTTRDSLNLSELREIEIAIPPLPTQRRIATVLRTVDEVIEMTEQRIEKKQAIKQGLLHDLFTRGLTPEGHLRPSPTDRPDLYQPSPLGLIPKEWEVIELGSVVLPNGGVIQTGPFGSQLHAHEYYREGVAVIMPQDIEADGSVDFENAAKITTKRAATLSRHFVSPSDVVFARRGDLSRCAVSVAGDPPAICGTGCLLLRPPRTQLTGPWIGACYRSDFCQRQIAAKAVGTTMVNLNTSLIAELRVPMPSLEEQAAILERIDAEVTEIRSRFIALTKLRHLKSALMQDLLTGRVSADAIDLEGGGLSS